MTATRVSKLEPEGAYFVLARAQELERQGKSIIHLEIGEPDFPTPGTISGAGIRAIQADRTRYNPPRGIGELREAVAKDAGDRRGISINPDEVVIAPGAKPILFFPMLALLEPGDEVMYPDPGFPTYRSAIDVAEGIPVPVPLAEENGFSFDLKVFDKLFTSKTKLILLNSPANPTGGIMPKEDLEYIAEKAADQGCWILSDEIYSRIVYDGLNAPSIAAIPGMPERTIILDGFSKTYSMTGWRLGYGIMPKPLADKVQLLLTHSVGCTAHFTQYAGLEAITGDQAVVDGMVSEYEKRRNAVVKGLNDIPGIRCINPLGAFYAFPNVSELQTPVDELANRILEEAGVALLPGTAFGPYGEGYLRLSYCNSLNAIEDALQRIRDFVCRVTV
jgi:aspartate aminotransferase